MAKQEECKFCMYHEVSSGKADYVFCHHSKTLKYCNGDHCEDYKEDYKLKEMVSDIKRNPTINNEKIFKRPFSFRGRIGRMEYFLSFILCCGLYYLTLLLAPLGFLLIIPYLWFWIAQSVKRCHDVGNSGFYVLLPFYILWLLFASGDEGINQYGSEPDIEYDKQLEKMAPSLAGVLKKDGCTVSKVENKQDDKFEEGVLIKYLKSNKMTNVDESDKLKDCSNLREKDIPFDDLSIIGEGNSDVEGKISSVSGNLNAEKDRTESENTQSYFYLPSFINHYFPFHKGYRRLLFVCWIIISLTVEISQQKGWRYNVGWGIVSLIVLLVSYFVAFWIYNGFKESPSQENNQSL